MTTYRPAVGAVVAAAVPFAAMCFSVPLWDRVDPVVLGLPFNLFWLVLWILLTPVCMRIAYRFEAKRAADASDESAEPRES